MPENEKFIASKAPYSAEVLIRKESHTVTPIRENGYAGTPVAVEGGLMLKITLSADTLPAIKELIQGHVALTQ